MWKIESKSYSYPVNCPRNTKRCCCENKDGNFALLTDDTTDVTTKQQCCIIVRVFDETAGIVKGFVFQVLNLSSATGEYLIRNY